MFVVYILYSSFINQYYVGHTQNIEERLARHNSGSSLSTRKGRPWALVYTETFNSRSEAMIREKAIKKMKSRKYIEQFIQNI
ncbi:MAG TPA: GIY-YIG nuclease family protein [Bacteroidia bacterium]|nr:GIY-YIG nuclease family protein [Bacteroidia bacterium]